jgi:hypothetical protein
MKEVIPVNVCKVIVVMVYLTVQVSCAITVKYTNKTEINLA